MIDAIHYYTLLLLPPFILPCPSLLSFYQPVVLPLKLFKFRVTNTETPIAAGLSLSGTLEVRPEKDEDVCDRLLLVLEDKAMEIPLLA